MKMDNLLAGGGRGPDQGSVPDLTTIKTTEATILRQIAELK